MVPVVFRYFVGIDLSWTARRPSGLAVIERAEGRLRLATWSALADVSGLARWLDGLGDGVVAGVDAPLVVGPARTAEAAMARALGQRGVRAFAAEAGFLERHNFHAGPTLADLLVSAGWALRPPGGGETTGRYAFETFPRGLAVTLLGFDRPPQYKRGPLVRRAEALADYREALRAVLEREGIAGDLPPVACGPEPGCPCGRALKDAEDRLDAALCAVAAFAASGGVDRADYFGTPGSGEIVLPGAGRLTSVPGRSCPSV